MSVLNTFVSSLQSVCVYVHIRCTHTSVVSFIYQVSMYLFNRFNSPSAMRNPRMR
jgi:hypothetical protein